MPSVRAGATMEPKNAARFGTTRRFLRAVFRAVVRANDAEWPFERGFRSARSQREREMGSLPSPWVFFFRSEILFYLFSCVDFPRRKEIF